MYFNLFDDRCGNGCFSVLEAGMPTGGTYMGIFIPGRFCVSGSGEWKRTVIV